MSKVLVPLLAVATLGLSAAAWQTYELGSERARAMALAARLNETEAKTAALEKEAASLRDLNKIFQDESEQLRKKLAGKGGAKTDDGPSAEPVLGEVASAGGEKPEAEGEKSAKGFMQGLAKMMKDPEMKKMMRSQQGMGMRMMYGDLAKEIGLNPQEADAVMELLTDRQLEMSAKGMEMLDGEEGLSADKMAESGKAANQAREEFDKQISDLIGPDRYKQFQGYEKTIGERVALTQLEQQMSSRGMAFEGTQRSELLKIMVDERQKAPPSVFDASNKDVAGQMKAMQSDEVLDQLMEQQKQVNARVLTRAAGVLSPDQVNALRESQEQFIQMQQFGMKMGRQMLKK